MTLNATAPATDNDSDHVSVRVRSVMSVEDVTPAPHLLQRTITGLQAILDRDLLRLNPNDTDVLSDQLMALMERLFHRHHRQQDVRSSASKSFLHVSSGSNGSGRAGRVERWPRGWRSEDG